MRALFVEVAVSVQSYKMGNVAIVQFIDGSKIAGNVYTSVAGIFAG